MKTNLLLLLGAAVVAAIVTVVLIHLPTTEYGPILSERAHVVGKQFRSSETHFATGFAVGSSGELNTVFTSSTDDARYQVRFRCGHGVFEVDNQAAFDQVDDGKDVTVLYREKTLRYTDGTTKPGGFHFEGIAQ